MKDDRVYIGHILRCISRIEEYTVEGRDRFFSSHLIQDGVLRNLQVMAESTQRLSDSLRSQHPEVDWKALAGFRNVLVHDYLGVDPVVAAAGGAACLGQQPARRAGERLSQIPPA